MRSGDSRATACGSDSPGDQVRRAARNNALWCDAVCHAHGRPGRFEAGLWIHADETPPRHPNAVTLAEARDPEARAAEIAALADEAGIEGWAVKDSFHELPLDAHGFRQLFEARWIRAPAPRRSEPLPDGLRVARVTTHSGLRAWEQAWRAVEADAELPATPVFRPALLDAPGVAILALQREGRVVAGVVGSRSGDEIGISNLFVVEGEEELPARRACIQGVAALLPRAPLLGYESGEALRVALALGFRELGPLRVWVR